MRIRVSDVLDVYAQDLTSEEILRELPDLEREDLQACLQYASRKISTSRVCIFFMPSILL